MVKPDLKARIFRAAAILRKHKISQTELADIVGASQPQVSRILNAKGLRATKLCEEICLYAERLAGGVSADAVRNNDELVEALRDVWDGSDAHAKALAVDIRSLTALQNKGTE